MTLESLFKLTSRNYVVTYNNPPDDWDPPGPARYPGTVVRVDSRIRFIAGQFERGEDSGLLHWQGYVVFNDPQRVSGAKSILDAPSAHLEVRRGSHQQALEYCTKQDTRVDGRMGIVLGEPPLGQGCRSDVNDAKLLIDEGGSLLDVAELNFGLFLRSYRALGVYVGLRGNARNSPPKVYYWWGPAGSGKTRAVYETVDPSRLYSAPLSPGGGAVWFDGYMNHHHDAILLDDYYHNWKLTFFLQFCDRYPLKLPIKGGFVDIGNCDIYITSNIPLEQQYPNAPDQNAIRRRMTEVKHFNSF